MNGDHDKTVLITGASTGIGLATASALAERGVELYLACRSETKTAPVIETLRRATGNQRIYFLPLDLADLESVRACAGAFGSERRALDVLINNAGIAGPRGVTKQGFELTFGTNHLGHFLLTQLLVPRLTEAPAPRVVHVASDSHYSCTSVDWSALNEPTRSVTAMKEYEVSKLCNILFARESAVRIGSLGVRSYAVDPGTVASDIWRRVPWPVRAIMKLTMQSTKEGARSSVHCALSPDVAENDGLYYSRRGEVTEPSKLAKDAELARELWDRSITWTGLAGNARHAGTQSTASVGT